MGASHGGEGSLSSHQVVTTVFLERLQEGRGVLLAQLQERHLALAQPVSEGLGGGSDQGETLVVMMEHAEEGVFALQVERLGRVLLVQEVQVQETLETHTLGEGRVGFTGAVTVAVAA